MLGQSTSQGLGTSELDRPERGEWSARFAKLCSATITWYELSQGYLVRRDRKTGNLLIHTQRTDLRSSPFPRSPFLA
jgi:hypothetical protein